MQTSIDKFGRVLIPKHFREQLNLEEGQAIELLILEGSLILAPERQAIMKLVKGVPVFEVEASGEDALEWSRSERDRALSEA